MSDGMKWLKHKPAGARNVSGFVERATADEISGWAIGEGSAPVELALQIDGSLLMLEASWSERPDVAAKIGADEARVGFSVHPSGQARAQLTLAARQGKGFEVLADGVALPFADNATSVTAGPAGPKLAPPSDAPKSYIEAVRHFRISGWAAAGNAPVTIFELLCNGEPVECDVPRKERQDVAKALGIEALETGFEIELPGSVWENAPEGGVCSLLLLGDGHALTPQPVTLSRETAAEWIAEISRMGDGREKEYLSLLALEHVLSGGLAALLDRETGLFLRDLARKTGVEDFVFAGEGGGAVTDAPSKDAGARLLRKELERLRAKSNAVPAKADSGASPKDVQRIAISAGNVFNLRLKLSVLGGDRSPLNFVTQSEDIALHLDFRLRSGALILNSFVNGRWGWQVNVPAAGMALHKAFWFDLRFSYNTVEVLIAGHERILFTMPVKAGEISGIESVGRIWEAVLREDLVSLSPAPAARGLRSRTTPRPGPRTIRLTAAAIDCDERALSALAEFCDEVVEIDTAGLAGNGDADRSAIARRLVERLNEIAGAAEGNFIAVSRVKEEDLSSLEADTDLPGRGKGDKERRQILSSLVADLDLRFRKDPFLLALGSGFAFDQPWMLALPGGLESPFVSFLDAVSPASGLALSSVSLRPPAEIKNLPGAWSFRRPSPARAGDGIVRRETGKFAVVLCDRPEAAGGGTPESASKDQSGHFVYTLRRGPRAQVGVEGDFLVAPDLPAYYLLPKVADETAEFLFKTTDLDAVLFLHGDGLPLPSVLPGVAFGRCEWAHLAAEGTPVATFIARKHPDGDGAAAALPVKEGARLSIQAGAGFWDTDKVEWGTTPACEALLKTLRSPGLPLPGPGEGLDPRAPLPVLCLSAVDRLVKLPASADSAGDYETAIQSLSLAEAHRVDWGWCVYLAVSLGHLAGLERRTRLLELMARTEGVSLAYVCEQAGQDSLWEHAWDDALFWFERWNEEGGQPLAAGLGVAKVHLISGNAGKALDLLGELSGRHAAKTRDMSLQEAWFNALEHTGQWDQALDEALRLFDTAPAEPALLASAASCALHAGRFEEARALLVRLRRSGKHAADALYLEARLLQRQGRVEESARRIDEFIAAQPEYKPLSGAPTAFNRLDSLDLDPGPDSVSCIIVGRNEGLRLPWLLDYYRGLGVETFIVVDNGSTDGSVEYLLKRGDVRVFQTRDSYAGSRYGVKWHNELADDYLRDRWVLVVDADEVLVYPGVESVGLPRLCAYLDAGGYEGLRTFMLDMYPAGPLSELSYESGRSLIEAAGWFDGGPYLRLSSTRAPYWSVSGGVRERFFWRRSHGFHAKPPAIHKIPLVKWRQGMKFLSSTHEVSPLDVADVTGLVLHFKFLQDFHRRAMIEVKRKEHYKGATEYAAYLRAMEANPRVTLMYPGSVQYQGSADLVQRGLMAGSEAYERFRAGGPAGEPGAE